MKCPLLKLTLVFYFLIYSSVSLKSQVQGKLKQLADLETYQISIIPNQTIIAPNNITNTGQITLKVTSGSFELAEFKAINGLWQFNARINQPEEAPNFDYIIFNLAAPVVNPNYQKNQDYPLFQFKNANGCLGSIELIENGIDEFWPPNSLQANIGNHMTIFGFGIQNAYHENDDEYFKITCPSQLEFSLHSKPIKCAGESTPMSIHFKDGVEPLNYTVTTEEGVTFNGVLSKRGDSIIYNMPEGTHSFLAYNENDTIQENLILTAPDSLALEIIYQEKVGCEDSNGAKVELKGTGGLSPDTYIYEWSDGHKGHLVEGLDANTYQVTLSDSNNCSISKEIIIKKLAAIQIDSVEKYQPSCFNDTDGIIEVLKMVNTTPPIQYALDKNPFQEKNYFDNLKADAYQLHIKDANNCRVSQEVVLINPPKLTVELNKDTTLFLGQSYAIRPQTSITSNIYYEWSPTPFLSCLDCTNPTVTPNQDLTLNLKVSNENGCDAIAEQTIRVIQKRPIYIPSGFSPNGDGINDLFQIHIGQTIKKVQALSIYNRWGQLIYQSESSANQHSLTWDGTYRGQSVESGTYLYIAEIEMDDQTIELYKGDFFILK